MKRLFLSLNLLFFSFFLLPAAQATEEPELSSLHKKVLGAWSLAQINAQTPEHQSTLQITRDNIFGNTGCNNFFATIGWLDQGFWEITPPLTTRKGCIGTQFQQEKDILGVLLTEAMIRFDEISKQLIIEYDSKVLTYQKES